MSGRVVAVADGDTITLLDNSDQQHKIRLAGIRCARKGTVIWTEVQVKPFIDGVQHDGVQQECPAHCGKRDRYQRQVCKIVVDGRDVNLELVTIGMAWWYEKYQKEQLPEDRATYRQAHELAKFRGIGLWNEANPHPAMGLAKKVKKVSVAIMGEFSMLADGTVLVAGCLCAWWLQIVAVARGESKK